MRIAFHAAAVLSLAAIAACGDFGEETFNPIAPDPAKARIRIFNATNTPVNMSANGEAAIALNSNLPHGGTRCFVVNPASPGLKVVQTGGAEIPLPSSASFEAGKNYMVVLFNPTTTTTNFSYAIWDVDGGSFTPHADSAGLRVFNAAAPAGSIDLYVNPPAVAPATEPALNTMTAQNRNVAVGSLGNFFNVQAGSSYQYRVTRAGVNTGTPLVNTSNTLVRGEKATVIISLPAVGTTTLRANTTQGC